MYEGPIKTIFSKMNLSLEDDVCKAVQHVGIDIDKEELIKALQYDRDQYNKGYQDGYRDRDEKIVRCKDCKHRPVFDGERPVGHYDGYDLKFPDSICPCRCEDDEYYSWYPNDDWYCPAGERKE